MQAAVELEAAVRKAHKRIQGDAKADRLKKGMGTTVVVGLVCGLRLFIASVGDSRVYIQRQDRLVRVTRDQTMLNAFVDDGVYADEHEARRRLRPEIADTLQQSLGRLLGEVVITVVDLRRGDRALFCSDGLTRPLEDESILGILRAQPEPAAACGQLVQDANNAGGPDNVTTIVVNFDGEPFPPPTPEDVTGLKREVFLLPEF
jgi:protein phosphatase